MSIEATFPAHMAPSDSLAAPRPLQPLAILRRRRTPMIVAFLTALVVAVIVAAAWPPTYISSATILIEQQEMPLDLVRSTISSNADQRLQVINQRVMITDNLLRIIQRYDLYPEERKKRGRETILTMMRNDMSFRTIRADVIDPRQGRPMQATIAFAVGFKSPSAESAAKVATELSSLYLEENLQNRRRLTDETTQFLSDEAGKLSKHIAELDEQISQFKEQHVNTVPEREPLNVQLLTRADDEKRDITARLNQIDQQLLYLNSQLAQVDPTSQMFSQTGERVLTTSDRLKLLRTQYEQMSAIYAPDHPDVVRMKREMEGLEKIAGPVDDDANDHTRQLQQAEADLVSARERYAPDHPDVARLERLVTALKSSESQTAPLSSASGTKKPDNPLYIQLMTQKESLLGERRSEEAKQVELTTRAKELERRLETSPLIERQYVAIARELENTQSKYREVRQKQMEAQLAQSLESERKGERFSLIEPAIVPQEPASPNRVLILVLGSVLALAAALGIAVLLEVADGSVRGRADVMSLLTAPPLAVVPWFENAEDRVVRRRKQRYAILGIVVAILIALAFVHFLYRPLDLLWTLAMRRLDL
jgi:succinoglycan biosynthesis transport protein ExoP